MDFILSRNYRFKGGCGCVTHRQIKEFEWHVFRVKSN